MTGVAGLWRLETVSTGGLIPARRSASLSNLSLGGHTESRIGPRLRVTFISTARVSRPWRCIWSVGLQSLGVISVGSVGGTGWVSGCGWLHCSGHRGDLFQQCGGTHDPGAERLEPSAQLRVGSVDQRRRRIRARGAHTAPAAADRSGRGKWTTSSSRA